MDLISVVIPVYNCEKFISECAKSFLKQTYSNFELIFVNDGSTDNTLKILESYNEPRIKIYTTERKNAGAARNFGLKQANGKYIIFFDGDDWADKKFLEKMHKKITRNSSDMVICASCEYNQQKKTFMRHRKSHTLELLDDENRAGSLIELNLPWIFHLVEPWNKMYCRNFLTQNNITFQEIQNSNDLVFFIKTLTSARKIAFVKDELVFARKRIPDSITTKANKNWKCYFESYKTADEIMNNYPQFNKVRHAYEERKAEALIYFFKKTKLLNKFSYYTRLKKEFKSLRLKLPFFLFLH